MALDRIIVSKFIRTIETAEPTIKKFPETAVHLWIDTHEFHYLDPKKYVNATSEERDNFTIEYWKRSDPFYRDSHDVETYAEFIDRINDVILKLKKIPDGMNLVFTHGILIRAMYILLNFYPNFNSMSKTDGIYLEIMKKQEELRLLDIPAVKNTAIFDISAEVERYSEK